MRLPIGCSRSISREGRLPRLERLVNVLEKPRIHVAIDEDGAFARLAPVGHTAEHVKYSDFSRFKERQAQLSGPFRELFRTICNSAEDVAIERQMASEFSIGADFAVTNDAFRRLQDDMHRRYVELFFDADDEPLTYTVFEALTVLVQDSGFGRLDRQPAILDTTVDARCVHGEGRTALLEMLPEVRSMVEDVGSIPCGTRRVDRVFECFERIRPVLEDLPLVQLKRVQTREPRSFESETRDFGPAKRADDLADPDAGATVSVTTAVRETPTRDQSSLAAIDTLVDRLGTSDDDRQPPIEREARALLRTVRFDETPVEAVDVCKPDPGGQPPQQWFSAREAARVLESDLRAQLRRLRHVSPDPGHRIGDIDPHRLVAAAQGRSHVFRRRADGDDRDYSCLIVLDRSRSMFGDSIDAAEDATAQLVVALSSVGVDVSVLSLLSERPRLELPLGAQPRQYAQSIFSGRAQGGTPLSEAIAIGRDRLSQGSGSVPLMIVLTDGVPDNGEAYQRELDRCTFPVFGIYVTDTIKEHAAWFDRILYAEPSSVDRTLRDLARRLFRKPS